MSLFDQISEDIKKAMLAKDKTALDALRGIKKEFLEAKTAKGGDGELHDDKALQILQKMSMDQRNELMVELMGGLEIEDYQFSRFIPDYLGVVILYLPPKEIDETINALQKYLDAGNERTASAALGTLAIATNPFELFVEFGQRIKARAKARQVMLCQLSNGLGGYLPTHAAVDGGSYSSKPASTVCGPEGGEALIEKTLETIDEMF